MIEDKRRNTSPTRFEHITGKLLILIGLISAIIFVNWLLDPEFVGYRPLYYILIGTFIYKIIRLFIEWALCFHLSIPEKPPVTKEWKVDVLTTYCPPEPKEMVIKTLMGIKDITYPHKTYLCDEADDEELKRICKEMGVIHVTRKEKKNAKAGNINNALYTVADGDICVILDPDHEPFPNFLDEVLPYFEDEKIGYVQVVQAYYNHHHTIIAKAAAQQTYQYYGPFMMGLNTHGAVPAIGANCTFRRSALDSIGGHAPGLTEDMHTSMLLHSKGWKSVYNPVIVAKGLVPWNYSGYCLQQLKWARGSFDLFFNVIPRIFRKLTWKQLLYYCIPPFFYLSGLVSIIDFLIPVIALLSGIVPIKISIFTFFQYYIPLFVATIAIRQFNQKWLLEQHEKGSFIFGGTLLKASWWAILLGFLYSLINKKVPYIPTPKGFKYETPLKLLIPNFILIGISGFAIYYGLSKDFNSFNLFMAFLAGVNILILSLGSVMAIQHLIIAVHNIFKGTFISKNSKTRKWIFAQKQKLYGTLQLAGIPLIILTVIALFSLRNHNIKQMEILRSGTFISADFFIPNITGAPVGAIDTNADLLFDTLTFDSRFLERAKALSDTCSLYGKMPYFIINFDDNTLNYPTVGQDSVLLDLFHYLREKYVPVFMGVIAKSSTDDSVKVNLARRLYDVISLSNKSSFPNIAWVWHTDVPYEDSLLEEIKYKVSWLQTSTAALNYQEMKDKLELPVLVAEDNMIYTLNPTSRQKNTVSLDKFKTVKAENDGHQGRVSGNPFQEYIKGVAYNPGHDWRDNKNTIPLTRLKLEHDFRNIKDMGANMIRRYSPSLYDRNIFKVANEMELNVLYGFWFDPKVDYSGRNRKIRKYEREVLRTVRRNKNNPVISGWTLGNETWGLLKHNFNEPYLSMVRKDYLVMINDLAEKIKKIDPDRPVLTAEEHTYHISAAAHAVSLYAPSIDVFAVNSYYLQNIGRLDSIMKSVDPDMPYLVGEFGPKGYWHEDFTDFMYDTLLYEQNSHDKAELMAYQWNNYIKGNAENNLGGFAFCWQDRYEGTATWFGMTDIFGNRKPSWNAMKVCFTGDSTALDFPIPRFHIMITNEFLLPDLNVQVFAATHDVDKRDSYYYKWIIYEEETFKKIEETPYSKGKYNFRFNIPTRESNYRLYLYVSDNNGNVVTESTPIIVNWNRWQ